MREPKFCTPARTPGTRRWALTRQRAAGTSGNKTLQVFTSQEEEEEPRLDVKLTQIVCASLSCVVDNFPSKLTVAASLAKITIKKVFFIDFW